MLIIFFCVIVHHRFALHPNPNPTQLPSSPEKAVCWMDPPPPHNYAKNDPSTLNPDLAGINIRSGGHKNNKKYCPAPFIKCYCLGTASLMFVLSITIHLNRSYSV